MGLDRQVKMEIIIVVEDRANETFTEAMRTELMALIQFFLFYALKSSVPQGSADYISILRVILIFPCMITIVAIRILILKQLLLNY